MRKAIFGIVIMGLLMTVSCSKPTVNTSGSWTFKSVTYEAIDCQTYRGNIARYPALTAFKNNDVANTISISISFDRLPDSTGIYTVGNGNNATLNSHEAGITVAQGAGKPDHASIIAGQTILVTVAYGKISASGTDIKMVDTALMSDTSTVTFSIKQQ